MNRGKPHLGYGMWFDFEKGNLREQETSFHKEILKFISWREGKEWVLDVLTLGTKVPTEEET